MTTPESPQEPSSDLAQIQHDLLGVFDITLGLEDPPQPAQQDGHNPPPPAPFDPKQARIDAAFLRARQNYTVKIDSEAWYLPSSSTRSEHEGSVDVESFTVPSPSQLKRARIENKRNSLDQEWTINYLYSIGRFDLALAYSISFLHSMDLSLHFDLDDPTPSPLDPYPGIDVHPIDAQPQEKGKTKSKKASASTEVKGPTKEMLDTGLRCVLNLFREEGQPRSSDLTFDPTRVGRDRSVEVWTSSSLHPSPSGNTSDEGGHYLSRQRVRSIALSLLAIGYSEVRRGSGDPTHGFRDLVRFDAEHRRREVNADRLKQQNWTTAPGLALSLAQVAVEVGQWRCAVESCTLFLANRGAHWRGLLPCVYALSRLVGFAALEERREDAAATATAEAAEAARKLTQALTVLALQSVSRRRRGEMARLVLTSSLLPPSWIDDTLSSPSPSSPPSIEEAEKKDSQILNSLLLLALPSPGGKGGVLNEETIVALHSIVCARKGGVTMLENKLAGYLGHASRGTKGDAEHDEEEEEEEGEVQQPRSVRTL